jgi:hypothetical protein
MLKTSRIFVISLVSAIGGLVFLANSFSGSNNWLTNSISTPPTDSQGLLPIANAIGKDLMLDVSPQLHPSIIVGASASTPNGVNFQHWIDQDIHCEDCLRVAIPNNGEKVGVAFSNGGSYNFEDAKKMTFFTMAEEEGAMVNFKAVGKDKDNGTTTNVSADDLFKNQEFALTSQNVTLNQTWSYFEMSLDGVQTKLNNVKYPFAFVVEQGTGEATILYIKGIMYSSEPVDERYLLQASTGNLTASTLPTTNAMITTLNVTLSDNATETVTAPATVEFNATVATGEEPYSFDWDFRDGAQEKDTDGNTIHTFSTPGLYNVRVNVTDSLNNTGSANTIVDVAENLTQDSQATTNNPQNTTETAATTTPATGEDNQTEQAGDNNSTSNSTAAVDEEAQDVSEGRNTANSTAREPEVNNNSTETGTNELSNGAAAPSDNSPPVANAGNDLVGKPNEKVILDASKSTDPDPGDRIESYLWEQESGPDAKIDDKGSPTPIVTLPDGDKDAKLVFSLTVNDGTVDSEKKDTVSIFVDYADALTNNPQQKVVNPADIKASQWMPSEGCKNQDDAECLSDGSSATFVAAGTQTIDSVNLYSFGDFSEQGAAAVVDPSSLVIQRVVAEITAKKTGNTGYISFAVDDPREKEHYFTPSLSIASSSFQKYNYVWDVNPITGEKWTYDSLNSLIAGFRYDGGQSGVEISELQLTVSYNLPEPSPPKDVNTAQDTGDGQANADRVNDENSTNSVQDSDQKGSEEEQQQEPAIEKDSTNSTSTDADGEGTSSSES